MAHGKEEKHISPQLSHSEAADKSKTENQNGRLKYDENQNASNTIGIHDKYYNPTFVEDDRMEKDEGNWVNKLQEKVFKGCSNHRTFLERSILLMLFVGYTVYFAFAVKFSVQRSMALIVITSICVFFIIYGFIRDHFGERIYRCFAPVERLLVQNWDWLQWFLFPALAIATVLYLSLSVVKSIRQLQSLSGFIFYFLLIYITSKYPDRIRWRPVIWGLILQFVMAILVLRWEYGYIAVKFLADEITKFMEYAFEGAASVFGDPWMLLHAVSFVMMPMLVYVGAIMSILFYCGVTQALARKLTWLMQKTLQTTAIETFSVASNIYLSGLDSLLMFRHYLLFLTRSEFNCMVVGNHATVAGLVFALFVAFGAPPQHLLSAAVMSAPATMAIAKLNYPETEVSLTRNLKDVNLDSGSDTNVFEAAANGALVAGKVALSVVANLISFLGMLAFINATLSWLGGRVGFPELSFELMCSYIMWPFALIMGVDFDQCQEVAKLLGLKLFTSELLAFQELGRSKAGGRLSERSGAITTYALCGFSSMSTLAISLSIFNQVCPPKTEQMASLLFRVLVEANVSCFMTACIAGLFYSEDMPMFQQSPEAGGASDLIGWIIGFIPGYKQLMSVIDY